MAPAEQSTYGVVPVRLAENDTTCYFQKDGFGFVNPLHDIPLYADKENKVFNMIVEIPRWTNAKLELKTKAPLAPVVQDEKKGKKRFVHNVYPYKGYIWNYGCFPQTWEDPTQVHMETGALGDGDPLDVCEVGSKVANVGDVIQVKVLGVLGMIDEGEMDWKIVVLDVTDPMAKDVNDVEDLYRYFPGLLHATFSWFRTYKVPDGKALNVFAFQEQVQSREYALEIVDECHHSWRKLVDGTVTDKNHSVLNTTLSDSKFCVSVEEAASIVRKAQETVPETRPVLSKNSSANDLTSSIPPPEFESSTGEIIAGKPMMTIKRFCTDLQRKFPHGSNDLSLLITEMGVAYKCVRAELCDSPCSDFSKLAAFSNAQIHASLASSGLCCLIFSSLVQTQMPLEPGVDVGNYIVVYDPLTGVPGGTMGSTFSVLYRKSAPGKEGDSSDLLQRTGYEQVAAGYCLFSSVTILCFSMGYGVHMFMLDQISGHFILVKEHVSIPKTPSVYSVDVSVLNHVVDGVRKFVDELDKPENNRVFRYEENIVGNFHRCLTQGGIMMMPGPNKNDLANFLGVAGPLAFIIRQAGGRASVGKRPLLELSAWSLEMSVPMFCGSESDVDRLEELVLGRPMREPRAINPANYQSYAM